MILLGSWDSFTYSDALIKNSVARSLDFWSAEKMGKRKVSSPK
jgi:hypothetical protein